MASQETHIRRVEINNKLKVFGKFFDKSEKGYKAAGSYSKDVVSKSISGETLKCIIDKESKTILIKTSNDFPIKNIKVVGTSSFTRLKGTYNKSGTFTRGFGDVIKSILDVIPNISSMIIDFDVAAKSKLEKNGGNHILSLSAFDYNYINGLFNTEKKASSVNSQYAALKYLGTKISKLPAPAGKKGKELSEAFKRQVHEEVINNFDESELEKLLFQIYNKYFSTLKNKIELFKKTDTRKLEYVLQEFDLLFANSFGDEKKWQALFEQHYRVINPNYKYVIREVDTIFESLDIEVQLARLCLS